ncbi:MAG: hypothetical protein H0W87_03925 [Actinobacteria bacterium]|nr:hypothetical protein [Actinomycetota bacterium]
MTQIATEAPRETYSRRSARAYVLSALGPVTVVAGIVWALLQPYRLTFLHPRDQGFWWLLVEPQLLVMLVGALFHFLVVPSLLEDLNEFDEEEP